MFNTKTVYTTTIAEMLEEMKTAKMQDYIIRTFISHLQNDKDYARERFVDSPEWRKVITDISYHNFNGHIEAPVFADIRNEIKDFLDGNGFIIEDRILREDLPDGGWSVSFRWYIREAKR